MVQISTDFGDGVTIVYGTGRYGEQIVAYTKCYPFFGEDSTETPERFPGEK